MIGGSDGSDHGCVIVGVGASSDCDATLHSDKDKTDDKWHYVVWTRSKAGKNLLYVDADQEGSLQDDGSAIDANRPIQVGGDTLNAGAFLQGTLDELRISNVVRSAAWIKAQDASMRDTAFVIYGAEESAP